MTFGQNQTTQRHNASGLWLTLGGGIKNRLGKMYLLLKCFQIFFPSIDKLIHQLILCSSSQEPPTYLDISPLGSSWWSRLWEVWARWEPQRTLSRWTSPAWWCPPGPEHILRHTGKQINIHISKNQHHFVNLVENDVLSVLLSVV